jgi:ATP-dependent RNA helicase DDX3X
MSGEDLMCCAQTGSGKTCAFLLPVCAALASNSNTTSTTTFNETLDTLQPAKPRCVVLAPTRELASQIELEAQKLTFQIPSVTPVVVYGGAPSRPQLKELAFACSNKNALIVVATPGRLTDFVDREIISLSHVQFLVLDEADRMLDMGFMVRQDSRVDNNYNTLRTHTST